MLLFHEGDLKLKQSSDMCVSVWRRKGQAGRPFCGVGISMVFVRGQSEGQGFHAASGLWFILGFFNIEEEDSLIFMRLIRRKQSGLRGLVAEVTSWRSLSFFYEIQGS